MSTQLDLLKAAALKRHSSGFSTMHREPLQALPEHEFISPSSIQDVSADYEPTQSNKRVVVGYLDANAPNAFTGVTSNVAPNYTPRTSYGTASSLMLASAMAGAGVVCLGTTESAVLGSLPRAVHLHEYVFITASETATMKVADVYRLEDDTYLERGITVLNLPRKQVLSGKVTVKTSELRHRAPRVVISREHHEDHA